MEKLLAVLLAISCLQCSGVSSQTEEPLSSSRDWLGSYESGDGFSGVTFVIAEDGSFSASSYSCQGPFPEMTGEWMEVDGWIVFTPTSWDSNINFSLPRMKMCRFQGEYVLLPGGDESALRDYGPDVGSAYWRGGNRRREDFRAEMQEWRKLVGVKSEA